MELLHFLKNIFNSLYIFAQIMIGISVFAYLGTALLINMYNIDNKYLLYIRNISVHFLLIGLTIAISRYVDIRYEELLFSIYYMIFALILSLPFNVFLTCINNN